MKYHEGFANGFAVLEFSRERAQMDYWFLDDREKVDTPASLAASWEVRHGSAKLFKSAAALS